MDGGGSMRAEAKAEGLRLPNSNIGGGLLEIFVGARKLIHTLPSPSALSLTASVVDTSRLEVTAASWAHPELAWKLDDFEFWQIIIFGLVFSLSTQGNRRRSGSWSPSPLLDVA